VLAIAANDRATFLVTGEDRVSWLNGLVTCDLAKKRAGDAAYGLVVGRTGRILADVFAVIDDVRVLLAVPAGAAETIRQHFEHYLVMEDAELGRRTDGFAIWFLHGPRSGDVLAAARGAGGSGGMLDQTGLDGAIVFASTEYGGDVRNAVERSVSGARGAIGDAEGWEALRLERAVAKFGADFDDKLYPQEASLEKIAVSFNKGCYLGQEVVCMLELRGHVKRRLSALVIDGPQPEAGAIVTDAAGAPVGELSSAAWSPTLGRPVALAILKRSHAEPGSVISVDGSPARVVDRPA